MDYYVFIGGIMNNIAKILLLVLPLILTACSDQVAKEYKSSGVSVDEELIPYFDKFVEDSNGDKRVVEMGQKYSLTIIFADTGSNLDGLCVFGGKTTDYGVKKVLDDKRTISINPKFWMRYDERQRQQLFYHEMGHCVLGLEHDDRKVTVPGVPRPVNLSYMATISTQLFSQMVWEIEEPRLNSQLFTGSSEGFDFQMASKIHNSQSNQEQSGCVEHNMIEEIHQH
jgi:hypothetical protein